MILLEKISKDCIIAAGCTLVVIVAFLGGCTMLNQQVNLPDDNIIEEIVEDLIEEEIGIPVDLTPNTKE